MVIVAVVGRRLIGFPHSWQPLWTPPGVGSLQPALALTYSHDQHNGIIGMGWQVSGLSTITRCNKTVAQDGIAGGVNVFDPASQDRYCLDGVRMRLVMGNYYGERGSTYRTELDTYSRITQTGMLGNGPAGFRVERMDGLTYQYGSAFPDVRPHHQIPTGYTEAQTWALSSIADRSGNTLTFTYTLENGALRPDEISYAGQSVKFVYESAPRPDPIQGYQGSGQNASGLVRESAACSVSRCAAPMRSYASICWRMKPASAA